MPRAWETALDALVVSRVILVIGAAEAGKTTFTAWLANALHARGHSVAIVDADVGQSEIGPPTTVGLGRVRGVLQRTGDAELIAFEFAGVTSPGRRPWAIVDAVGRISARAREQFDRVIVDTSGFVAGGFAAAVKQRKIAAVDPDLVVLLQRENEAEHIVRAFEARARPRVLRLPAIPDARPRTAVARRRHRDAALARHLEGARAVVLSSARVVIRGLKGERRSLAEIPAGAVIALHDAHGDTRALGVVIEVDVDADTLTVRTTCDAAEIAAVTVGETMTM